MPVPLVHPTSIELWRSLGRAFTDPDEADAYQLLQFIDAFASQLGYVDDVVRDTADGPGWSSALDPDVTKVEHLRWLGQFVGVQMASVLDEAEMRGRVNNREGWGRGKVETIRRAAQLFLTGSKTVEIYERDGSAYRLRVRTFAIETTDAAKLAAEVQKQKPGALVLTHEVVTGGSYAQLDAAFGTYDDQDAAFVDYNAQTNWVPA